MILNDVLGAGPKRVHRFRVGRGPGSGNGKTCGRGQHGAYSRSGVSIKLGFEGGTMRFFRKIPRRGFSNAAFRNEWSTVNVDVLNDAFQAGETVTLALAIERGAVRRNAEQLKVLGNGEITKALTLDAAIAVSAPARAKIEKAGGTILMPAPKKEAPNWRYIKVQKDRAEKVAKTAAAAEKAAEAKKDAAAKEKVEKAERAAKGEAKQTGRTDPGKGGERKPGGGGDKGQKGERGPRPEAKGGPGPKGDDGGKHERPAKAEKPAGEKPKKQGDGDGAQKQKK